MSPIEPCRRSDDRPGRQSHPLRLRLEQSLSPRIYAEPLSLKECAGTVRSWLEVPATTLLEHDSGDIDVAFGLLESAGAGGSLTTDAQIGALALRYRATVHTADTDFVRLRNVPWRNPLTGRRGPR